MNLPPPDPLTPPPPALWAPRFRRWLNRLLTRLDRRKARILAVKNISIADWAWRSEYYEWWWHVGWSQGAVPPQQAWEELIGKRAAERKKAPR